MPGISSSGVGKPAGARLTKDSIYKGCKTKTLITFELERGSLLRCVKISARGALSREQAGPGARPPCAPRRPQIFLGEADGPPGRLLG